MFPEKLPESLKNQYLQKTRNVMLTVSSDDYAQNDEDKRYLVTVIQNMRSIGFIPDNALFAEMSHLDKDSIVKMYGEVMPALKEMVGADNEMNDNVIYKNFPLEVMEKDDFTLYSNAIFYYCLTIGGEVPHEMAIEVIDREKEKERFPLIEESEMKVLSLGSEDDFMQQIKNIAESKITVSPADKAMMEEFIKEHKIFMPEKEYQTFMNNLLFQNKENQCLVCAAEIKSPSGISFASELCGKNMKTATDVLRLATYLSSGNTSVATNTKFKLTDKESQVILSVVEKCATEGDIAPDMFKFDEKWKRISHIVHPKRNASKYPLTAKLFDDIYNGRNPITWASQIEDATMNEDFDKMSSLLSKRPGELFRRLEKFYDVARKAQKNGKQGAIDKVISLVEASADKCAIPVLIQEMNNLKTPVKGIHLHSKDSNGLPAVHIGELSLRKNNPVDTRIFEAMQKGLVKQLSKKEYVGKIYLDDASGNVVVPTHSMADTNKSLTNLETGSRVPKQEGKDEIRFSIWWNNGESDRRTDVDLHAVFLDENYNNKGTVSFYNLKNGDYKGFHSGDVTDGGPKNGKGVSEHIVISDIDKDALLKKGVRYIAAAPDIYPGCPAGNFGSFPATFSVQERESQHLELTKANVGQIYEPSAVTYQESLSIGCKAYMPVIYDVKTEEWVITRLPDLSRVGFIKGENGHKYNAPEVMKLITEADYLTIKDYAVLFEKAGIAQITDNKEEADIIIGLNRPEEMKEGQEFMLLTNPTELTSQWLDDKKRPENILKKTFETQKHAFEDLSGYREILESNKDFMAAYEKAQLEEYLDNNKEILEKIGVDHEEYMKLDEKQMSQVLKGEEHGLAGKDIAIYARPDLKSGQMKQLRKALENGVPAEEVKAFASPDISKEEMKEKRVMAEMKIADDLSGLSAFSASLKSNAGPKQDQQSQKPLKSLKM